MRYLTLAKARHGFPYMILGASMTFFFLSLHHTFVNDGNSTGNSESWPAPIHGRRHLRNLPNPCSEPDCEQREKERELMIKLMTNLLEKLNKSLNVPDKQVLYPRETKLEEWVPKMKDRTVWPNNPVSHFTVAVSAAQKVALYDALLTLEQVARARGFTWMLYSGTLLGSWRHHDMIPWDDDFDIFMNYTQREQIKYVLSNMGHKYDFFEAGSRMKFWATNGTIKGSSYPWKWPYLDISFFKENKTHIWDGSMEDDYGDRLYMYPKSIVFPLHLRPMGKYFFPSPRDSLAHLKATYKAGGMGMCWTTHYSHRNESLTDKVHKIMCDELKEIYPFVHRAVSADGEGIHESLRLNDKEIHTVFVREPTYAITNPYALSLM